MMKYRTIKNRTIKNKCKLLLISAAAMLFAACGGESVNVISKDSTEKQNVVKEATENAKADTQAGRESESKESGDKVSENQERSSQALSESNKPRQSETTAFKGFVFEADGKSGKVSIGVDADIAPILKGLKEPSQYFEAPSCAFKGLDKIYTFDHYQIETYPDNQTDRVSSITFLDDLVTTHEGASVGMGIDEIKKIYGDDYKENDGSLIYEKDDMRLVFIAKEGYAVSVQYNSNVLNRQ